MGLNYQHSEVEGNSTDYMVEEDLNRDSSFPIPSIKITKGSVVERWKNESLQSNQSSILPLPKMDVSLESSSHSKVPKSYYSKYLPTKMNKYQKNSESSSVKNNDNRKVKTKNPRTIINVIGGNTKPLNKTTSSPDFELTDDERPLNLPGERNFVNLQKSRSEDVNKQLDNEQLTRNNKGQVKPGARFGLLQSSLDDDDSPLASLNILSRTNNIPNNDKNKVDNNINEKSTFLPEVDQYITNRDSALNDNALIKNTPKIQNVLKPEDDENNAYQGYSDDDFRTATGALSPSSYLRKTPLSKETSLTCHTKPLSLHTSDALILGGESPAPLVPLNPQSDRKKSILIKSPVVSLNPDDIKLKVDSHVNDDNDIEHLVDSMMDMAKKNLNINDDLVLLGDHGARDPKISHSKDKRLRTLMRKASITTSVIRSEIGRVFDYAISQVHNGNKNNNTQKGKLQPGSRDLVDGTAIQKDTSFYTFSKWLQPSNKPKYEKDAKMRGVVIDHPLPASKDTAVKGNQNSHSNHKTGNFIDRICLPEERTHFYLFVVGVFFAPAAFAGALIKGNNIWRRRCIISSIISIIMILIIIVIVVVINNITL